MALDLCEDRLSLDHGDIRVGDVLVQVVEEPDQRLAVAGAFLDLEHQRRLSAVRLVSKRPGHRQPFPAEPVHRPHSVSATRWPRDSGEGVLDLLTVESATPACHTVE
jgi:hypothetical protein